MRSEACFGWLPFWYTAHGNPRGRCAPNGVGFPGYCVIFDSLAVTTACRRVDFIQILFGAPRRFNMMCRQYTSIVCGPICVEDEKLRPKLMRVSQAVREVVPTPGFGNYNVSFRHVLENRLIFVQNLQSLGLTQQPRPLLVLLFVHARYFSFAFPPKRYAQNYYSSQVLDIGQVTPERFKLTDHRGRGFRGHLIVSLNFLPEASGQITNRVRPSTAIRS